ncbi:MAG: LysR family transcriptional regulator [Propionivibrio sp.]|nr:LysR family transcriptional regulator [Propionivibrio sp.]
MINSLAHIKSRLHMRHLRLLSALSEEGSLRRTAEKLAITQPGATKILQEIEELLGQKMFVRTTNGLQPNGLGEAAIRYARLVFADLDSFHEEILAIESGHRGRVRIGAISALAGSQLPQAIAQIKADYPMLNLSVTIATSDMLVQALKRNQLDLLLARIPQEESRENLAFEPFGEELILVAARGEHPEMHSSGVNLAALIRYPWVIHPQATPLREIFHQIFREAQLDLPPSQIETDSIMLTASLLQRSDAITLMSLSLVEYYQSHGILNSLPIRFSSRLASYGLIYRKSRAMSPSMAIVSQVLRAHHPAALAES